MKTLITEGLLRKLPTTDEDIYDTRTRGLVLRCRASGRHTYRLQVRRGRWLTIGNIDDFTPAEAREEADRLRGDVAARIGGEAEVSIKTPDGSKGSRRADALRSNPAASERKSGLPG